MESALSVKGQATIPKSIREHLGLKAGDRIKFFVHPDGSVVILPKVGVATLQGIIPLKREAPPSLEEMERGVEAGAVGTR